MQADGTRILGFVEKNRSSYWDRLNTGIRTAAAAMGDDVRILAPDDEDVARQRALAWDLLEQGVDGLALVATESDAFDDIIAQAVGAGLPVVTFDLDAPVSVRHLYVGLGDYHELGRSAGREMVARLEPGATVLLMPGSSVGQGSITKVAGFRAELEEAGIEVVEGPFDEHDEAAAERLAADLLRAHDVQGVFGPYAYHPAALARAVARAGVAAPPVIVGFDMNDATVAAIRAGTVDASIWIREYYFGFHACASLATLGRLGIEPGLELLGQSATNHRENRLLLRPETFTAENVDRFDRWRRSTLPSADSAALPSI